MGVDGVRMRRGSGPYECEPSYLCSSVGCESLDTFDVLSKQLSYNAHDYSKIIELPDAEADHMVCRQCVVLHDEASIQGVVNGCRKVEDNFTFDGEKHSITNGVLSSTYSWDSEFEDNCFLATTHARRVPPIYSDVKDTSLNRGQSPQVQLEHSDSAYSIGQQSVGSGPYVSELCATDVSGLPEQAPISLADYLDEFKHPDCSMFTRTADRRLPIVPRMTKMPQWQEKMDLTTQSNLNTPPSKSENDENDGVKPDSWKTEEYLLKRRAFLRIQLAERFGELIQLLNEEVELTATAPKGYQEALHEYELVKMVVNRMYANSEWLNINFPRETHTSKAYQSPNLSDITVPVTGDNDSKLNNNLTSSVFSTDLRCRRVQQTGYVLPTSAIRRVHTSSSMPGKNILSSSQHSLNEIGTRDVEYRCYNLDIDSRSQGSTRSNSSFSTPTRQQPNHAVSGKSKYSIWGSSRYKKKGICGNNSVLAVSMVDLTNSSSATSLNTHETDTNLNKRKSRDLSSSIVTDESVHEKISKITSEFERQQRLAWINVELETVRKIMEANLKFAHGGRNKKAVSKFYTKAVKENIKSIEKLEKEGNLLQNHPLPDYDLTSIESSQTQTSSTGSPSREESGFMFSDTRNRIGQIAKSSSLALHSGNMLSSTSNEFRRKSSNSLHNMYDGLKTDTELYRHQQTTEPINQPTIHLSPDSQKSLDAFDGFKINDKAKLTEDCSVESPDPKTPKEKAYTQSSVPEPATVYTSIFSLSGGRYNNNKTIQLNTNQTKTSDDMIIHQEQIYPSIEKPIEFRINLLKHVLKKHQISGPHSTNRQHAVIATSPNGSINLFPAYNATQRVEPHITSSRVTPNLSSRFLTKTDSSSEIFPEEDTPFNYDSDSKLPQNVEEPQGRDIVTTFLILPEKKQEGSASDLRYVPREMEASEYHPPQSCQPYDDII